MLAVIVWAVATVQASGFGPPSCVYEKIGYNEQCDRSSGEEKLSQEECESQFGFEYSGSWSHAPSGCYNSGGGYYYNTYGDLNQGSAAYNSANIMCKGPCAATPQTYSEICNVTVGSAGLTCEQQGMVFLTKDQCGAAADDTTNAIQSRGKHRWIEGWWAGQWCTFAGQGAPWGCYNSGTNPQGGVFFNEGKCSDPPQAGGYGNPICGLPCASSAGDPHIVRFDGTAFDIDTLGSYSLFNVAGGNQLLVTSTVETHSTGKYNMKCEFGGAWLRGHNVTAVAGHPGLYFDSDLVSISDLVQDVSQYTWEITEHAKMTVESCGKSADESDYCESVRGHRKDKGSIVSEKPYMTMATDAASITVRWSGWERSHLDIYASLRTDFDSTQIGGLLAGSGKRRTFASSVGAVSE